MYPFPTSHGGNENSPPSECLIMYKVHWPHRRLSDDLAKACERHPRNAVMWAETKWVHATKCFKWDGISSHAERLQWKQNCRRISHLISPKHFYAFTGDPYKSEMQEKIPWRRARVTVFSCLLPQLAGAVCLPCSIPVLEVMSSDFPATDIKRNWWSNPIHKCTAGPEGDSRACVYLDSSDITQPSQAYAETIPTCQEMPCNVFFRYTELGFPFWLSEQELTSRVSFWPVSLLCSFFSAQLPS